MEYLRAMRGDISGFTGIDDPYEPPPNPEIELETLISNPEENASLILNYLKAKGLCLFAIWCG